MNEHDAPQPEASAVLATGRGACKVEQTPGDDYRVALDFRGLTVYFSPEDAHLIGAQMIAVAARIPVAPVAPLASVKAPA